MRLSKFSKKWIAYVCAIAMVVSSFVFTPAQDVNAAEPDWSTIDYLADGAGGGQYTNKYKYYCEDGSAVNIQKPGFADEAGIYATFPAADIQMDIDGYAVQGAGACLYLSNFTKKVTEINVTYAGGSTKAYVYYEDGEEGPTTTVDPSAPTAEPTTANPWKSIPNGGSQWYYNNSTKQNISSVVNIQKPGWAAEDGVYITVPAGISEVDVNGETEGVAAIDGAGFVVYLSAMTKKINEVTITHGLGTSSIQIKNENGTEESTEAPTEAPTEVTEAPTEAPTEVTEAPTEAPTEVTEAPTEAPTEETTEAPTEAPTEESTEAPTEKPVYPYDEWVNTDRNLALAGTAADTGVHREGTVESLNDGVVYSWDGRDGITTADTPGSFDIELDKAYDAASIDQVAVYWRAADANFYPSSYQVQFGYKGTFTTVATVSGSDSSGAVVEGWTDEGRYVTDIDFTNDRLGSAPVDTVRIYVSVPVGYGCQAREVAVFAENPQDAPEQPQAAAPASVQGNSPDYGTIAFSVTPGEDQDGYKYNVYAGDTLIGEGVDGNQEYVAYGFNPGDYTLKAVSIVSGMDPSDPVYSETITVADPLDLFASPMNKAVGGAVTAVSSFYNDDYTLESSQCAVDGTPAAGEGATVCIRTGAGQAATIDIDLQKDYDAKDLESFVLAYTNPRTYAANTQIGISADGEDFVEVANSEGFVPTKDGQLTANLIPNTSNAAGTFRYVRINLSGGTNTWGYVVNQIGVIVDDSEEPTTEAPTAEPTTEAPTGGGYDMHQLGYDAWTSIGGEFYGYTGSGNGANVEVGYNTADGTAKFTQVTGGQWWDWGTQIAAVYPDLTDDVKAGKTYNISWTVHTENGVSGNVLKATGYEQNIDFSSGEVTLTGTLVYNEYIGQAAWCIGTMWVPEGVSVIFDKPVISGDEPTTEAPTVEPSTETPTVEPSTEAPTVEPSTEAPTEVTTQAPTQEPTTQAPTQKPTQAPTVAPTVPKPVPVIKIPGKAKVKKAVKKKKSAKKIKVKIKKIKGAKGYQVAVYKTKKKAKKNKKALVKKYTKKTKLTIKSKKFKKKKKLYVKVRAYVLDGTTKVFGAWSKPKKTKKK